MSKRSELIPCNYYILYTWPWNAFLVKIQSQRGYIQLHVLATPKHNASLEYVHKSHLSSPCFDHEFPCQMRCWLRLQWTDNNRLV